MYSILDVDIDMYSILDVDIDMYIKKQSSQSNYCNFLFADGTTIHKAFDMKFGFNHPISDQKMAMFRDVLSELKIVVIDEMSMVGADLLYGVNKRLRDIFCSEDVFAGKSVILVGDLLQIRPVEGAYIFKLPLAKNFKTYSNAVELWKEFEPYVLRENHRQGEGNVWANHLNDMRIGKVTDEVIELLKTRLTDEPFLDDNSFHIFYTNYEVSQHNIKMIDKLETEEFQIPALLVHPDYWKPETNDKTGTVDTTSFLMTMIIKVGARVSMVFNISLIDGLVNGARGKVVGIEAKNGEVSAIIVAFDNPNAGERQREKYPNLSRKYADVNGTPIMRFDFEYPIKSRSGKPFGTKARVIQFPLRLSWASTAHKMQVSHFKFIIKVDTTIQSLSGPDSSKRIQSYLSLE